MFSVFVGAFCGTRMRPEAPASKVQRIVAWIVLGCTSVACFLLVVYFAPHGSTSAIVRVERIYSSCSDPRLTASLPPPSVLTKAMVMFVSTTFTAEDNYQGPELFDCSKTAYYGGDPAHQMDGGKWICGLRQLQAPCTIYSLGSHLDFSFEANISAYAPCEIVVADCTVDVAAVGNLLPPHVRFFPLCLGSVDGHGRIFAGYGLPEQESTQFVTLPSLMRMAGHTHIDLLKVRNCGVSFWLLSGVFVVVSPFLQMDIEGGENGVIESLLAMPRHTRLPFQISVETHGGNAAGEYNRAMAKLGYVAVKNEINIFSNCCWEWTWVRVFCDLDEAVQDEAALAGGWHWHHARPDNAA